MVGMGNLENLSVIIPVAPNDQAWVGLIPSLLRLPVESELIFVSPQDPGVQSEELLEELSKKRKIRWVQSKIGRAVQLNKGAHVATKAYFWFLHADSRFNEPALQGLSDLLDKKPNSLIYFNLKFNSDGPSWTQINNVGVWLRSNLLKMPFGDQGFCMSKNLYQNVGGFDENCDYGEDHLFVWRARILGISLQCTGSHIYTSARKYKKHGWLKTTMVHLYLTYKQAFPAWYEWRKKKIKNFITR